MRRYIAYILLIPILILSLCAAHSCSGENCAVCAMLRTYRAVYIARRNIETARTLPMMTVSEECGAECMAMLPTLVSEKVELRD